ncbi:MAG: DUF2628 domain-containing protein [Coriobacteriia bacterium]|nr:DUF2628 domain-containing protein [Coriobacteriia bacterium]
MADTGKPTSSEEPAPGEAASDDTVPREAAPGGSAPGGIEAARVHLRDFQAHGRKAAHCAICDQLVLLADDGSCPNGHPVEMLGGFLPLAEGDPCPKLPRFNVAAFAMPPVWGAFHGQWAGVLFLPIWVFVDSAISTVMGSPVPTTLREAVPLTGAVVIALLTLAFQLFFAKRANGAAWRKAAERLGADSVDRFCRRQRLWAVLCVPLGILVFGWMIYYRLTVA